LSYISQLTVTGISTLLLWGDKNGVDDVVEARVVPSKFHRRAMMVAIGDGHCERRVRMERVVMAVVTTISGVGQCVLGKGSCDHWQLGDCG
jgi:hypothetical protein